MVAAFLSQGPLPPYGSLKSTLSTLSIDEDTAYWISYACGVPIAS